MTDHLPEVPGFRTIGSLGLPIGTSPDSTDSIPMSSQNGSATTGTPSRGLPAERPTGRQLGAIGAAETLIVASLQGREPSLTDETLVGSWALLYGSSPVVRGRRVYDRPGGYDELPECIAPPPFFDEGLAQLVERACRPGDAALVTAELARLKVGTVGRAMDGVDLEAWLTVVGDEIEEFPPDVIRAACRKWLRREKWTPSVAELREECNRLFTPRRMMRDAMRAGYGRMAAE